jgi:hypothetical protein
VEELLHGLLPVGGRELVQARKRAAGALDEVLERPVAADAAHDDEAVPALEL